MHKEELQKLMAAAMQLAIDASKNTTANFYPEIVGPVAAALVYAALSADCDASVKQALMG